jgi:hypothetical protein
MIFLGFITKNEGRKEVYGRFKTDLTVYSMSLTSIS